jgi:hypothetical protein
MIRSRSSQIYTAFVVVTATQLLALWLIGDSRFSLVWLGATAALIVLLAFRSRTAWWLLLLMNAWGVVAAVAIALAGGEGATSWGDAVALVLGSGALVALLASPAMRAHLRSL